MKKISTAHILLLFVIITQTLLSVVIKVGNIQLPVMLSLSLNQISILLPFVTYCIIKRQNPFKLIRFKKIRISTALLSILIAFCSYPVVVFLNFVSMLFVENAMTNVMPQVLSNGLFAGILLVAVTPAIVEETLFRGVIYNTYSKRKPILAIFLSACLFGLMHGNFNQMPYACFLGIIMALLMEACDSIIAPMIFHFTMNASSTLISYMSLGTTDNVSSSTATDLRSMLMESYRMSGEQMGTKITEEQLRSMIPVLIGFTVIIYAIIAVFALIIVLALIYAVFHLNHRKPSEVFKADCSDTAFVKKRNGELRKNRMIDVYLIIFIIYTVVVCVLNTI